MKQEPKTIKESAPEQHIHPEIKHLEDDVKTIDAEIRDIQNDVKDLQEKRLHDKIPCKSTSTIYSVLPWLVLFAVLGFVLLIYVGTYLLWNL